MSHALVHPYEHLADCLPLRGNLHAHTTGSDGRQNLQTVIHAYADRGYDFLAITDHDLVTGPQQYGCVDSRGLVLIPGNEITASGPHLCHINCSQVIRPIPQRQAVINMAINDPDSFIVINHPNWQENFDHCSSLLLKMWKGYLGIEVFNGIMFHDKGSPYAFNKWDILLSEGRRVWGFCNDDSHDLEHIGVGWNIAFARERSLAGVMDALRHGRFYGSTGVTITRLEQTDDLAFRIETDNAQRICAVGTHGRRLQVIDGPTMDFVFPTATKWNPDPPTYVRFECWGPGETFAWTQPLRIVKQ